MNLWGIVIMMVIGWCISLYRNNVTIVDSLWPAGFVLVAWMTWYQVDGFQGRKLMLAGLTTVWGLRLLIYLTWRNYGKGEDPRYARWRKDGGRWFWLTSLFTVFLVQALFLWIISLVVQAGQTSPAPVRWVLTDLLGALVWLVGFFFEAIGDWQLAKFKADPSNHGKVMSSGLWHYSRHPNYFGECLVWWGLFIIAVSDSGLWWTAISPVVITIVLLKMTGIPLTEKVVLEKKPGYKQYCRNTSAFIPWLPKQPSPNLENTYE